MSASGIRASTARRADEGSSDVSVAFCSKACISSTSKLRSRRRRSAAL